MSAAGGPNLPQRRSPFRALLALFRLIAINFLIFAVLVELVCLVYINVTNWPSSKPTYHVNHNTFFADINPVFGVWHRPNGHFLHQGGCYSVEYTTNSYGARDIERTQHSSQPRTVVLGDSFVEGLGLPDQDRLSNILEKRTGHEYLNFGTSGDFGPLQYALLYKSVAAGFDHKEVLVGVLPDNDFRDMSLDWGKQYHAGRYRPYYDADYSIIYTGHFRPNAGEGFWDRVEAVLRAYLASYHAGQYVYSRLYWFRAISYSGYNDYEPVDLERLKHALLDIASTAKAHGATMHVFLIPTAIDFERLHKSGANRLGAILERWGKDSGVAVKDLLPDMDARSGGDYHSYFLRCDGHWSAKGNIVAADILQSWLAK
jgi:hypothetical protein